MNSERFINLFRSSLKQARRIQIDFCCVTEKIEIFLGYYCMNLIIGDYFYVSGQHFIYARNVLGHLSSCK